MPRLRPLALIPLVAAFATLGCGGGNPNAPAKISGSVSLNGKPLPGGTIMFYAQTGGTPYSAAISPDGTYAISDVPLGELIVCVDTESLNPEKNSANSADAKRRQQMMGDRQPPAGRGGGGNSDGTGGGEAGKYVKIDKKYSKPETSPLTFTATNGRNIYNAELK